MARTDTLTNFLTDIADSIREKKGTTETIACSDFDTEIDSITTSEDLTNELNTYDYRLTTQETTINAIEAALVGKAASSGSSMNIFIQEDEPDTKNGIWIRDISIEYDDVVITEDLTNVGISWSDFSSLPLQIRDGSIVAINDNEIYMIGGLNNSNSSVNSIYLYNKSQNNFTYKGTYPKSVYGIATVKYGTDIYCFGGRNHNATPGIIENAYIYNTLNNSFSAEGEIPNLPIGLAQLACGIVGDDIYLFGGQLNDGTWSNRCFKYNIPTKTYTELSSFEKGRNTPAACTIGTDIFIFGGWSGSEYLNEAWRFDTITETFTRLANMPYNAFSVGCVSYQGLIYIFGGATSGGNVNYVYKYDISKNIYTQLSNLPIVLSRISNSSVVLGNDIYIFGGETSGYSLTNKLNKGTITTPVLELNNNSIIISVNDDTGYRTKIANIENGTLKLKVDHIYKYNKTANKLNAVTSYYGNGTTWIKI